MKRQAADTSAGSAGRAANAPQADGVSAPADGEAWLDAALSALASPLRRRLLDHLRELPGQNQAQLAERVQHEVTRFAVMKHLAALERGGLVASRREGRERRFWFDPTPIQWLHQRWGGELASYWAARLTRLKAAAEGAELHALPSAPAAPGAAPASHPAAAPATPRKRRKRTPRHG